MTRCRSVTAPRPRTLRLRTPKLTPGRGRPSPGRQYYAGYNAAFVEDVIEYLKLSDEATVLDPWNGGGTTTTVASVMGRAAVGFDVNPVLVLIGKSKLLGFDAVESLGPFTTDVLGKARDRHARGLGEAHLPDPLTRWFTAGTAEYIRCIEQSIQSLFVKPGAGGDMSSAEMLDATSLLGASFYVVLFETVRSFLVDFMTTNPTWVKQDDIGRVSVAKDRIDSRFRATEAKQHRHLAQLRLDDPKQRDVKAVVRLGDSTSLALEDRSVEACITSPPYCTRIDYAVLTRPELAVLGVNDTGVRTLRDASIGTPTITSAEVEPSDEWGAYLNAFVDKVTNHTSKASKSYYRRFYLQYFANMAGSLRELRRVVADGGRCALVVQDSYYKDVHLDLAKGLAEMAGRIGWAGSSRQDFKVTRTIAQMNAASRQYRQDFKAVESLILLRS